MSLLIRRIVFFIAAFVLPLQSWAAARASDCAMTISMDAPAHCCKDSRSDPHHSAHGSIHALSSKDKQSIDEQAPNQCLSGASCHCSAVYQQGIPVAVIPPFRVSVGAFTETNTHFVVVTPPPLWRPPIAV